MVEEGERGTWAGWKGDCKQRGQKPRSKHALACLDASNPSIAAVPDGAAIAVSLWCQLHSTTLGGSRMAGSRIGLCGFTVHAAWTLSTGSGQKQVKGGYCQSSKRKWKHDGFVDEIGSFFDRERRCWVGGCLCGVVVVAGWLPPCLGV